MLAVTLTLTALTNNGAYANPNFQQGQTKINWDITSPAGIRYLPGGEVPPATPNPLSPETYAFITSAKGFVRIRAGIPADPADFLSLRLFVLGWNGTSWNNITLYQDQNLQTPLNAGLDATSSQNSAYIRTNTSSPSFYVIEASYILAPTQSNSAAIMSLEFVPALTQ